MKEPSLFSRKYRGRQVLIYSPEQAGREGGQGSQPLGAVPGKGPHTGGRADKRVRSVLLPEKRSRRPQLTQAGRWAGPTDPEVTPGRKAPHRPGHQLPHSVASSKPSLPEHGPIPREAQAANIHALWP